MISAFCRGGCFEEAKQLAGDFEAKYDKYDVVLLMVDMHRKGHQPEEVRHINLLLLVKDLL